MTKEVWYTIDTSERLCHTMFDGWHFTDDRKNTDAVDSADIQHDEV